MKKLCIVLIALTMTTGSIAQTKKKPVHGHAVKKTAAAAAIKEPQTSLTAENAGRYAKDFAGKMYNAINFEDNKANFSFSINKWKPYAYYKEDGTSKEIYFVDVTISWRSAGPGWPTNWHDIAYNGIMMFDEFGCEPFFMIKTKTEPSSKGLNALVIHRSPVEDCSDKMKDQLSQMDTWCEGVNYAWTASGCLNY